MSVITPQNHQRNPTLISSVVGAVGMSITMYPLIRFQTLLQTQLGYSAINPELKLTGLTNNACLSIKESVGGVFRGLSFFSAYQATKAALYFSYMKISGATKFDNYTTSYLHSSVATLIATAASYPFELMQNRAASSINSSTPKVLNFNELVRTYSTSSNWLGYPLLYMRYFTLNTSVYLHFSGYSGLFPLVMGLATIPIDVIRRNFIISQWERGTLPYKNIMECSKYLIETHGYRSLFRGFVLYPEIYLVYFVIGSGSAAIAEKH
jgi:hypothetical protein